MPHLDVKDASRNACIEIRSQFLQKSFFATNILLKDSHALASSFFYCHVVGLEKVPVNNLENLLKSGGVDLEHVSRLDYAVIKVFNNFLGNLSLNAIFGAYIPISLLLLFVLFILLFLALFLIFLIFLFCFIFFILFFFFSFLSFFSLSGSYKSGCLTAFLPI